MKNYESQLSCSYLFIWFQLHLFLLTSNTPNFWRWPFASAVPTVWKKSLPFGWCLLIIVASAQMLGLHRRLPWSLLLGKHFSSTAACHHAPCLPVLYSCSTFHHKKFPLHLVTCVLTISLPEPEIHENSGPAGLSHHLILSPKNGA